MVKFDIMLKKLEEHYAGVKPALDFENPFELLVATILSAQCTDERVNKVTPQLFQKYSSPKIMADADIGEVASIIRSCGCYTIKAKNIVGSAKKISGEFGGGVPDDMESLTSLPGVGRKTASVVLAFAFGKPAFAVDTHVFRVANRLGLAHSDNVYDTEIQVCKLIPKEKWGEAHHWLLFHGREICHARKPECERCFVNNECKYFGAL